MRIEEEYSDRKMERCNTNCSASIISNTETKTVRQVACSTHGGDEKCVQKFDGNAYQFLKNNCAPWRQNR